MSDISGNFIESIDDPVVKELWDSNDDNMKEFLTGLNSELEIKFKDGTSIDDIMNYVSKQYNEMFPTEEDEEIKDGI